MLNSLPLIVVMILSLFLAFYCVDSHKENILSVVNQNEKPVQGDVEKDLKNVQTVEKVYVEELALDDTNKSIKKEDEIIEESRSLEKIESVEVEPIVKPESTEVESIKKVEVIEEVVDKKDVNVKTAAEYSENYELDDLEKMILEELEKGNKE